MAMTVVQTLTITCGTAAEWTNLLVTRDECLAGLRLPAIESQQEYPSTRVLVLQLAVQPLAASGILP